MERVERAEELDGVGALGGLGIASPRPSNPARGLAAVDALVCVHGTSGFVVLHGPRATLEAVGCHAARRAQAIGRPVVRVAAVSSDEPWRELAAHLGVSSAVEPSALAERIVTAAQGAVLLVAEGVPTNWGQVVAAEIARLLGIPQPGPAPLVLVLRGGASAQVGARVIDVDPLASPEDLRLWWEAIAQAAERRLGAEVDRLEALERWWSAARRVPLDGRTEPVSLDAEERRIASRLALAQRSWPHAEIGRLGAPALAERLVARGAIVADAQGMLQLSGAMPLDVGGEREDASAVAAALESAFPIDPWAAARASELHARAGRADLAEAAAVRALATAADPAARADFWRRWEATLEALPAEGATARLLRSAELALRVGDPERSTAFARAAAAREPDAAEVMLALGKALGANGDVSGSTAVLERALGRAPDRAWGARAAAMLAETRYMAADLAAARRWAETALAQAGELATRLDARNVLGKLLLASAAWSEAEAHFAADAWEAACGGEPVAELRAQLNRAIALLSASRLEEARSMLVSVLEEGTTRGELRASGLALANLATIAILRHDYPEAFELSERAIDVFRRLRERLYLPTVIRNLAELRLELGLLAEAEQTLAFGRKACGPAMPAAPHFSLVAARIHFARGRTREAQAELASATAGAAASNNGGKLCECYCVAARIALEDGHVARAAQAIAKAREHASSPRARAEVAVLEGRRARAAGEPWEDVAREALDLAREAEGPELEREARVLLFHAHAMAGDVRAAEAQLAAAIALRNRVAEALPPEIKPRYLARPELSELLALEARAQRPVQDAPRGCERCGDASCPGCSAPTLRPPPTRSALPALERMVGREPSVVSLVSAIRKVAASDATVLILGESGSGKELVADAIHELSPRRAGPLVKVNCSALVETLLLSELFGHEKGAFTGAMARRRGRFELAEGGTIFLDEIGDISARTQVALLRVLEDRSFERVGGVVPMRANVRIVCATHRDLRAMVARGEFREDLYYRLRQVVLEVPSLRQRLGDLSLIASTILARIAHERGGAPKRLSARALAALSRHVWPGNVRELENALRAAALFAEGDEIDLDDFTTNVDGLRSIGAAPVSEPPVAPVSMSEGPLSGDAEDASAPVEVTYAHVRSGVSLSDMKRRIERECIARALEESGGNITRAAALLGMKRPRLSQLVKQYGLGSTSEDGS
ncbi:sigma 54-interacting transcriptional regulator [Polyangium aurulentum]|uniref:sigma 54-interacting transcriptional regulator n=1 Tax=Polyangium aurulentum TaxID=2567896 RepID=UPI0010AE7C46|nr:sigma 54-interacting transcriptional regulator [Polyangium aurulentum]UQA54961.1 sigma 54-interacting transcriptional regulator [Polyangium aurulentum]